MQKRAKRVRACLLHGHVVSCSLCSFLQVLIVLRTLQSVVFATTITALSTWYIEFLPTTNRGMLMAAYSLGWPVGRAVVIFTASLARTACNLEQTSEAHLKNGEEYRAVRAECHQQNGSVFVFKGRTGPASWL